MALIDSRNWGSTPEERELPFPCDELMPDYDDALFRAIDIDAPPEVVYRWLCQLRAGPYSYDWIDNWGRRSPRQLTPGLEQLEAGQPVMRIFELASFERDRHITLVLRKATGMFGDLAVSYVVTPRGGGSRLIAKLLIRHTQPGVIRGFMRKTLPFGDAVMMRKQLRTLKKLAERG